MNAREKFGLKSNASVEEVRAKWQKVVLKHHPDHGGNVVDFMFTRREYQKAFDEASKPVLCPECQGTKRMKVTSGFNTIEVSCTKCK